MVYTLMLPWNRIGWSNSAKTINSQLQYIYQLIFIHKIELFHLSHRLAEQNNFV